MSGARSRSSTPTTSPASSRLSRPDPHAGESAAPLPRELLLLAAFAFLAVFAVYFLVVRTHWGQELDEHAFMGRDVISNVRALQADEFLRVVSIGSLILATIFIAGVGIFRGRPHLALTAAGMVLVASLTTEVLKFFILERPDLVPTSIGDNSYPSGHTTIGMSIAMAALLVVPGRLRMVTAVGAGAVGAAFGVAVVAAGWHRPSDAVGAYLICLAAAAGAAALLRAHPDQGGVDQGGDGRPERTLRFGSTEIGLLILGLALAAMFGLAALTVRGIPWTSAGAGFLISSAALVIGAFAATITLALTMNAADGRSRRREP